jgi:hypothetical protein
MVAEKLSDGGKVFIARATDCIPMMQKIKSIEKPAKINLYPAIFLDFAGSGWAGHRRLIKNLRALIYHIFDS